MTPDVVVAGTAVVGSIVALGGIAARIAKLVRGPLVVKSDKLSDELAGLQKQVDKMELRVGRSEGDIVNLGKADIEHGLANVRLRELVTTGFANIEKRLDELIEGKRGKR
jgi:hypothetical protein